MHYARVRRYGGPGPVEMMGRRAPLEIRFLNNVRMDTHCHIWTGCVHKSGYGAIRTGHRLIYVHRLAWQLAYGDIPIKLTVTQTCGNKLCVRIDHLELKKKRNSPESTS